MTNIVILGTQWGDEGKGKIVDYFAEKADAVVRFQGGNNAGHTLIVEGKKSVLHLIPSGVLHDHCMCILGPGMVINPGVFCQEIMILKENGQDISPNRIKISDRAHLIMPYHKELDNMREHKAKEGNKIGTTKRGIGPCYEDKIGRRGIRIADIKDSQEFKARLSDALAFHRSQNSELTQNIMFSPEQVYEHTLSYLDKLVPYIDNTTVTINRLIKENKKILFEGAQGSLLDIDYGTYPFVTSSNTVAGGVCTGAGVGPAHIDQVIGISKAYCTRVGEGPFPTELDDDVGVHLQEKGREFGATTGRRRRCGYIDLVALKHANMVNGLTSLILTKLDVLSGLKKIKIATKYALDGQEIDFFPTKLADIWNCKPIYQEFDGWDEDIAACKTKAELPATCLKYLTFIEEQLELPIKIISKGPGREENIVVGDVW